MFVITNEKRYNHNHTHIISGTPLPEDYITGYIAAAKELAKEIDSDVVIKLYADQRGFGFLFSSDDFIQMARFKLAMFGDVPNPERHVHNQDLSSVDEDYKQRWVKVAQELLEDRKIRYSCDKLENDGWQFRFDRPSHAALFFYAVDSGIIHDKIIDGESTKEKELNLDYFRPLFKTPGYTRVLHFAKK